MILTRVNNSILTNWYQKPTASERILNFNSNHHIQLKKNIIYNNDDRTILLYHKKFHKDNLKVITKLLVNNGYKLPFIKNCINAILRKIEFNKKSLHCQKKDTISIVIVGNVGKFIQWLHR